MMLVDIMSMNLIGLFQTVLVPVLMISGMGLFILILQTRYGRVVDRIRAINNERLELIKRSVTKRLSRIEKIWNDYRLQDLHKQMAILAKRGKLLKDALKYMFISIFTFIISSLLLFIEQVTNIPLSVAVLLSFSYGMLMLFMACVNAIKEVGGSFEAVMFDIDTHVPQEYRMKTEFGTFGDLEEK
ncbi:MAG: DUF2721 domain-containing protein [Candidatus Bathyarchaeia archaeon]